MSPIQIKSLNGLFIFLYKTRFVWIYLKRKKNCVFEYFKDSESRSIQVREYTLPNFIIRYKIIRLKRMFHLKVRVI